MINLIQLSAILSMLFYIFAVEFCKRLLYPDIDFKIFNLGGPAWKSFQELIAIQLYGLDIMPDIVIAFDGFNDIAHSCYMPINKSYSSGQNALAFSKYKNWVKSGPKVLFEEFKIFYYIRNFLSRRKTSTTSNEQIIYPQYAENPEPGYLLTRLDKFPVNIDELKERTDFDPYNKNVVDNYVKNMQLLSRSVSVIDTHLIVALQPTLYLKNPLSAPEEKMLWSFYYQEVNFVVLGYIRAIEKLNNLSEKEQNITFCDFSRIFEGNQNTLMNDNVHISSVGYGIISENLAQVISRYIENEGSSDR